MHHTPIYQRVLAAVAIALVLFGAGRLPEVDDLLERVPTAVRAATN
jgi:Sec-independent protein translocase protein TatA